MANPIYPTLAAQGYPIAKEIQKAVQLGHVDMTFKLNDLTATIIPFKLNPQEYESLEQPLEVAIPTNAGYYVFRWQVLPAQYHFQAYCGLQGLEMERLIDKLIGQIDIVWSYPYLGLTRRVRIKDVRRIRSSKTPYGALYDIQMQENNPLVKITQTTITQGRINSSFQSPTVYTPTDTTTVTSAFIDAPTGTSGWDSLLEAAAAVSNQSRTTGIQTTQQYGLMQVLNNNAFHTSQSPMYGWRANGGPKDDQGIIMSRLRYATGFQATRTP